MTVEVTSQARQRLFEIWERIARESSRTIADKVEERLLKRARELIPIRSTDPPDLLALFPHHFSEEVVP